MCIFEQKKLGIGTALTVVLNEPHWLQALDTSDTGRAGTGYCQCVEHADGQRPNIVRCELYDRMWD